jgi:hypothetical protein
MATEKEAREALQLHGDDLIRRRNVQGLGIQAGGAEHDFRVVVYVSEKMPESELKPEDILPKSVTIETGKAQADVPVSVKEAGSFGIEQK